MNHEHLGGTQEEHIATVKDYTPTNNTAHIQLEGISLQIGDKIRIRDFTQHIQHLEVDNQPREIARKGDNTTIQTKHPVQPNDDIYLIRDTGPKE